MQMGQFPVFQGHSVDENCSLKGIVVTENELPKMLCHLQLAVQ